MIPAYIQSLQEALPVLDQAAREAEESLPDEIRRAHWQQAKHSPCAWVDLFHAHLHAEPALRDPLSVRAALSIVCTLLRAEIVAVEQAQHPVNLTLAKVRRTP